MSLYYCPNCRAEVTANAALCRNCGISFGPKSSARPRTKDELATSAWTRFFLVLMALVVIGVALGVVVLLFQGLEGLAGH